MQRKPLRLSPLLTMIIQIPTLRECGYGNCKHPSPCTFDDGYRICVHCGATWDKKWAGGTMDRIRVYREDVGIFVWLEPPAQPDKRVNLQEWFEITGGLEGKESD